jgi:hypothetical protein
LESLTRRTEFLRNKRSSNYVYTIVGLRGEFPPGREVLSIRSYEESPGLVIAITREDDHIIAQATGQMRIQLSAQSETEFYCTQAGLEIKFLKNEKGEVTGMKLDQGGQTYTVKKTK